MKSSSFFRMLLFTVSSFAATPIKVVLLTGQSNRFHDWTKSSLATALAGKAKFPNASGENEPVLMAIDYGKGRVFHTTLGHVSPNSNPPFLPLTCVGFVVTTSALRVPGLSATLFALPLK